MELGPETAASVRRFRRNTYAVIVIAAGIGLFTEGWRMAAGIALGGALSLFNERWMRASTGAILERVSASGKGKVPRWTAAKFILRYVVIALLAGAGVWSGYFDLLGVAIGLASFVAAVMVEAVYQSYLTLRHGRQGKS